MSADPSFCLWRRRTYKTMSTSNITRKGAAYVSPASADRSVGLLITCKSGLVTVVVLLVVDVVTGARVVFFFFAAGVSAVVVTT